MLAFQRGDLDIAMLRGSGAQVIKNEYVDPRVSAYVEQPVGDVAYWGNRVTRTTPGGAQ